MKYFVAKIAHPMIPASKFVQDISSRNYSVAEMQSETVITFVTPLIFPSADSVASLNSRPECVSITHG